MLATIRVIVLAFITSILVACGGGGDGDSTPNFSGTYQLSSAVVSSNTCGGSVANLPVGRVNVIQNGRDLTWVEVDGSCPGTVDADNGGFTVTASQSGTSVTVVMRSGAGSSYSAKITANAGCTIVWTGSAVKTS